MICHSPFNPSVCNWNSFPNSNGRTRNWLLFKSSSLLRRGKCRNQDQPFWGTSFLLTFHTHYQPRSHHRNVNRPIVCSGYYSITLPLWMPVEDIKWHVKLEIWVDSIKANAFPFPLSDKTLPGGSEVNAGIYSPGRLTWETPCCQALPAGSWSYWTRDPGTPGCVVWQCRAGCVTGSCHWGVGQWGGLETTGLCWGSWLDLQRDHADEWAPCVTHNYAKQE